MSLSQSAFDALMTHLDPDRAQAGEKYLALQQRLAKFFDWNNCTDSGNCADEALNRVAGKLLAGVVIRDITQYTMGVARLIVLEQLKKVERGQKATEEMVHAAALEMSAKEKELRYLCMERCLRKLRSENFILIANYYQPRDEKPSGEKLGEKLAQQMGIGLNALRVRANRIRTSLQRCLKDCLEQESSK